MTETDFQRAIIEAAQALGWKVAHFRTSRIQRKDGSVYYATAVQADGEGFPDLVLAKRGQPIVFVEVKAEKGIISDKQREWLNLLHRGSSPALVIRPADFDSLMEFLR